MPGIFYVSDLLGGFYDQGYGYGGTYAMTGYINVKEDGTIVLLTSHVSGWGDSLDGMEDGVYHSDTKTLNWTAMYAGKYIWNIVLAPAQ